MGVRRDMLRHAALEEPRHCAEAPRADNHGVEAPSSAIRSIVFAGLVAGQFKSAARAR